MKGYWRSAAVLTASILAGSSPLDAHEDCDDISQNQSAVVASGESVGPRSQPAAAVTIQLFQYQPGQLEIQAGTTVTWVNQDDIRHTVTLGTPERQENVSFNFPAKGDSQLHLRSPRCLRVFLRAPPIHARTNPRP
jgi:plastocyanin